MFWIFKILKKKQPKKFWESRAIWTPEWKTTTERDQFFLEIKRTPRETVGFINNSYG